MKFSEYSINQFCESVYNLNQIPFRRSEISSVEMYQFIKEKSNDFDLKSFEYLILDIRNFHEKIKFEVPNPVPKPVIVIDEDTGYPSYENDELISNYSPLIQLEIHYVHLLFGGELVLNFTNDQSLSERVEVFQNSLPNAFILYDIDNLLKFSDIAEKEYTQVLKKYNEKSLPNTANQVNNKSIDLLQDNQINDTGITNEILSIFSLSPTEFCDKIYRQNDDRFVLYDSTLDITHSQMYQYIRFYTNSFDENLFQNMLSEIHDFIYIFELKIPKGFLKISQEDTMFFDNVEELKKYELNKYNFGTVIKEQIYDELDFLESLKFINFFVSGIDNENTLRQNIKLFKQGRPEAIFKHGLTDLLEFSDMAEKEFKKRNQSLLFNREITDYIEPTLNASSSAHKNIIANKRYLDLTPLDFCNYIYKQRTGFEEKECFERDATKWRNVLIPDRIYFQYLKVNTNDFDERSFDYLIADIRNFINHLTFHLPPIYQPGTESRDTVVFEKDYNANNFITDDYYFKVIFSQPEFTLETIANWDGTPDFNNTFHYINNDVFNIDFDLIYNNVNLSFDVNLNFAERFELLSKSIPLATFRYGIFFMLYFADFAEKEYAKVKSTISTDVTNNNSTIEKPVQIDTQILNPNFKSNINSAMTSINKYNFIELIREIGLLMPDTEVRRIFLENHFIEIGCTLELGYKQTSYFYNELKKARDGQETIYKGTLVKEVDYFGLVDNFTCYFKIYYDSFDKLENLFFIFNTLALVTTQIQSNEEFSPTIQTIWKTKSELIIAHSKFKKILKCDLDIWLFWFGGIPLSSPPQIKWTFKEGNKRALSYFIEKISMDHTIDYSKSRKIFDIQIYNKDKYQSSFSEIDNLLK